MQTFEIWKSMIQSRNAEVRSTAADNPPELGEDKEIVRLLAAVLQNDEDDHARTCAADSLGYFHLDSARDALRIAVFKEKNEVALGYVITSLGMIGELGDLILLVSKLDPTSSHKRSQCATREAILCITAAIFPREMYEVAQGEDKSAEAAAVMGLNRSIQYWIEAISLSQSFAKNLYSNAYSKSDELALQQILSVKITGSLGCTSQA
jgi:hypothetical protein